jgi:hypothetical protein
MNTEDKLLHNEELVKKIRESASQLHEPMTVEEFLELLNRPEGTKEITAMIPTTTAIKPCS